MVIQRVDVVADGGSSLYGSDAVTGTINVITRKSYEGFETQGSFGTADGGYSQYNLGAMAGHSWGSGNAYLAYQYTYNGYQMSQSRSYLGQDLIPLGGTIDNRTSPCALANVTAGGVTYALNSNTVANTPGALRAAATVGKNICDTYRAGTPGSIGNAQGFSVIPTEQQSTLWFSMNQHIAEGVEFSMTANAAFHTARALRPPNTTTNAVITNRNPFFQSIAGETTQTVSFDYSPVFGPYNPGPQFENQWEITPQLDIDLGSHGPFKDWSVNLMGNYGRSDVDTINYTINNATVNAALVSPDPAFALNPYNLAAGSKATLAAIQSYGQNGRGIQNIFQMRGLVQGALFSVPGGDIHWAIGAQYEKYQSAGDYYNGLANGVIFPVGAIPEGGYRSTLSGHRITESVFAEIEAPIISPENNIPFVNTFDIDVSATPRLSEYLRRRLQGRDRQLSRRHHLCSDRGPQDPRQHGHLVYRAQPGRHCGRDRHPRDLCRQRPGKSLQLRGRSGAGEGPPRHRDAGRQSQPGAADFVHQLLWLRLHPEFLRGAEAEPVALVCHPAEHHRSAG